MNKPVILVNPAGIPEPSPEIQRRLREVHSGLKLRGAYMVCVHGVATR
jgi:hypothetical protein